MIGAGSLDWVLDRAVAPGFSALGYRARGLAGSHPDPAGMLRDRNVVVTGASSGIGVAACRAFAELGASVHMVVRDLDRGRDARARISEVTGSDELHLHRCDVSSLASIADFVPTLASELGDIHALVHNAGVMTQRRTLSADGHELTLATHVLGPLLMTDLLTPLLAEAGDPRVVFVTSGGMYTERLDVDDLELARRPFDGPSFYAHAKRVQAILGAQLDTRLDPLGISVHSMHPGWVDTPGVAEALPRFHQVMRPILRTPEQGADTIVWLAASGEPARDGQGGRLWMDRRPRPLHRVPWTHESASERLRLWAKLAEMTSLAPLNPEVGAASA